jgi:hypothetical protein
MKPMHEGEKKGSFLDRAYCIILSSPDEIFIPAWFHLSGSDMSFIAD